MTTPELKPDDALAERARKYAADCDELAEDQRKGDAIEMPAEYWADMCDDWLKVAVMLARRSVPVASEEMVMLMRQALVQARGALRLDAMLDENGEPYGTTTVALEAINAAEEALTAALLGQTAVPVAEGDPSFENALEDAAKAAFIKAQSVYRADHDHFPLKHTWETTTESIREGWRSIAYAALEAAIMPPLGTQPEPRQPRILAALKACIESMSSDHPGDNSYWRAVELAEKAVAEAEARSRRCETNQVGASGECLHCNAEQGETCRSQRPGEYHA
jgi:hypothetical protein